ncbi:MAG: TetR/AcrR family transcriptional regulator [Rhodospirillaceae bacterium]|jgi:AcrR family transcriptional regulator|nr:TetR/AcrR family transcriptional regulator [Rhodospirillaceae bacterium]MBT5564612.1 TetR/AcrR family transcriptional regulator [Rhodospirillaceae bacterium]MBT6090947.1 TetR/AcrR family transcriptional regulator [Rhodospirillaceae bacterium]MBT7451722.1 TetR/AcrR family transcriptional regulator [Rhodospirillaceae bacterium]
MAPLDQESDDKPLSKAGHKREATKAALIEAFESLIAEEGVAAVGVNAVAKRAGVGKPLIYKYFDGFDGLVAAWASQSKIWGDDDDIFAPLSQNPSADPIAVMRDTLVKSSTELREKPVALQIMAHALLGGSELTAGLEAAKQESGNHHDALYEQGGVFDDPDTSALLLVMYAASRYLALRSLSQSNFNGVPLDTPDGWSAMMDMMTTVFDNAVHGAKVKNG